MFTFFLKSYRCGILDFCGVEVITHYDKNGRDGKFCFKNFDNGVYTKTQVHEGIHTKHPNVLKGVIIGKKGWGLWKNQWCEGISDSLFTISEILEEFEQHNIKIPEPLMKDFLNTMVRMYNKGV